MKSVAEIKQKMGRNKKNEKSVGLAELRREQERLLYLCDSIKLSVTKEEARVSSDDDYDEDDCTVVMISNFDDTKNEDKYCAGASDQVDHDDWDRLLEGG